MTPILRFKLSKLLAVTTFMPVIIAAAFYLGGCNQVVHSGQSDQLIRRRLLTGTPRGTSAKDVLAFIAKNFNDGAGSQVLPSLAPNEQRTIEAVVARGSAGYMLAELVTATWHFDDQDRVTYILISRSHYGP
ncbi:hypothetical protein ETAA8_43430 [Anatilimnocola aggregata]|uniref:Uncharacterized protein n=1 Tax=Anatilimnocola aggregata TaxID=2528021 RepID=A0A517YG84_9BACT|nr:hypothetical protein [Anatilimnocola aggregata]QDU29236.1 hypothetical protein ETAA8_43430 [Anatilimnocola aggregata]